MKQMLNLRSEKPNLMKRMLENCMKAKGTGVWNRAESAVRDRVRAGYLDANCPRQNTDPRECTIPNDDFSGIKKWHKNPSFGHPPHASILGPNDNAPPNPLKRRSKRGAKMTDPSSNPTQNHTTTLKRAD